MDPASLTYEEILTQDGSPSLRMFGSDGEPMHNRAGALSESRWIYGRLIEPVLNWNSPRFLSLGLGLGYNEILICETALQKKQSWSCVSYEADAKLSENFLSYLERGSSGSKELEIYDKIFSFFENANEIRHSLFLAYTEKRWIVSTALERQTKTPFQINGFLWDAFSQKTSTELWEEDFLVEFLSRSRDRLACGFSTYACTGSLKRALKKAKFEIEICPGFAGKRNSTLAWKKS